MTKPPTEPAAMRYGASLLEVDLAAAAVCIGGVGGAPVMATIRVEGICVAVESD